EGDSRERPDGLPDHGQRAQRARTEGPQGRVTPMARRPVDPQAIEVEIAGLRGLDLAALRQRWQKVYGRPAPAHLPAYLLFRIMAYKIQADAFGDLDRETIRFLDAVAEDWKKRRAAGVRSSKAPPP